jgi:hypothetical protein
MTIDTRTTLEAIQTLRLLPEAEQTDFYDEVVAPLISKSAEAVNVEQEPETLSRWLQIQSAAFGFALEGITEVTYELRQKFPEPLQQAAASLPEEQRIRIELLLNEFEGGENQPREIIERDEARRESELSAIAERLDTDPPSVTGVFGAFVGSGTTTSSRGFPVVQGTFTLFAADGSTLDAFDVNTGGGARTFRTTNGPVPPGLYRVSNHRPNRTTAGMVFHGVGYSLDLDPTDGTQVFGRSLFRIHPDGEPIGTNGCLGVRESAERLSQCETRLVELLEAHPRGFKIAVRF